MENPKIRFKKRQKKVWLAEKVGILIKSKSAKKRWNQIISNKSRCAWIKHPLKRSVRRYLRFDRISFSYLHPSSSAVRQWLWIISNIHRTLIDGGAHSSAFPFWWLALNSKSNFRLLWLDKQKISIIECWLHVGAVTVSVSVWLSWAQTWKQGWTVKGKYALERNNGSAVCTVWQMQLLMMVLFTIWHLV